MKSIQRRIEYLENRPDGDKRVTFCCPFLGDVCDDDGPSITIKWPWQMGADNEQPTATN